MFTIDMLPGGRGDALWIEYGKASAPHRVLIDGGIASTGKTLRQRIDDLDVDDRRFDLLIVTHIDLDHIAGILKLITNPPEGLNFDNVLFNGWEQLVTATELPDDGVLGPKLGERFSARLRQRKYPHNKKFKDNLVAIRKSTGALPKITLDGGMTITLLSPTLERLRKLLPVWEDEIEHAGLKPGSAGEELEGIGHPDEAEEDDEDGVLGTTKINVKKLADVKFKDDDSEANGSSIAVMAEYDGKRCAFLGDAYSSDIAKSISRMAKAEDGGDTLEIDAVKLSHHGGRKNTGSAMLEKMLCRNYLVSTDGTIYDHPHGESLSRVLVSGSAAGKPSLFFNYLSDETKPWGKKTLYNGAFKYTPVFPDDEPGISVSL